MSGIVDFLIGSPKEKTSQLTGSQKYLLNVLTQQAHQGPGTQDFQSSFGYDVPPLTSGQFTSLAGLENLSTQTAGREPGLTSTETAAGSTLEQIMGRSASSPDWQKWFDQSVTDPQMRTLESNDITRGRQFGDSGTFFSTDRVESDARGRQAFWDANSMARGQSAIANEALRAQAAGIVPSLRTPDQAGQQYSTLLQSILRGQNLPREVEAQQIQAELSKYMNRQQQENLYRNYQLGLLGIPGYTGNYTGGEPGLVQGFISSLMKNLASAIPMPGGE